MASRRIIVLRQAAPLVAALLSMLAPVAGQTAEQVAPQPGASLTGQAAQMSDPTAALLHVPVSNLRPGLVPGRPAFPDPRGNPGAAERGMRYFTTFNCIGCHAGNGAGGMGPALSNSFFLYGGSPANIFLTIAQGRPNGMPAWRDVLPDQTIWDLVAYVLSISAEPTPQWGQTISAQSPDREQVPIEFLKTTTPWGQTEPFSNGQKPR